MSVTSMIQLLCKSVVVNFPNFSNKLTMAMKSKTKCTLKVF